MINKLAHFALTAHRTVYDEEALSSLELTGRIGAKLNEIVESVNELNEMLDSMPEEVQKTLEREIDNGNLAAIVGNAVLVELGESIEALNRRINAIVATGGNDNTEVVDSRTGHLTTYETLGEHVRALGDGTAFKDAVRPGTVNAGRISAGMLGGSLAETATKQFVCPLAGKWGARAGYFDKSAKAFVAHSGYNVSMYIPARYGDTFILDSYVFGPRVYPVVVLNANGAVLEVIGTPGRSTWDKIEDAVVVSHKDAAYVQFITGVGYESKFRAYRVTPSFYTDTESAMEAMGYIRMVAKKRTDTVTDRAQVKVWFKLPEDRAVNDSYTIPVHLFKHSNLAGMTFRLFAATSDSTYDSALGESASGYTFDHNKGMEVLFKVPTMEYNGSPVTHVCLFVDFLPNEENEFMDVCMPPLTMGGVPGTGYALHGAVDTDRISIVKPGAKSSNLYGKRVLGIGDSLMRGNTLPMHKSWFNILAGEKDMEFKNAAVNGLSVADMATNITTTLAAFPAPDYVVLNGGANDLRLSVTIEAFKAAIGTIVDAVRASNPRCKILALTNWERSPYENALGLIESDYVEAMLEACEAYNVPCLNNYADSLDMTDPDTQAWADEGKVSTGTANLHFSEEANRHLVPRIAAALEAL